MRHGARVAALLAVLALPAGHAAAQQATAEDALREAHAVLLNLVADGETPERDGAADIYRSTIEDPDAPRLVTRVELALNPCRARTISTLQFPGRWATLTLGLVDLGRIETVEAYASVDDMISGARPLSFDDPRAEQVILTGEGLLCSSRISLADDDRPQATTCGDRLDLTMMDEEQRARGLSALAAVARHCKVAALRRP